MNILERIKAYKLAESPPARPRGRSPRSRRTPCGRRPVRAAFASRCAEAAAAATA
jgi:hypothetical protein